MFIPIVISQFGKWNQDKFLRNLILELTEAIQKDLVKGLCDKVEVSELAVSMGESLRAPSSY